jgi:hypothetical protein
MKKQKEKAKKAEAKKEGKAEPAAESSKADEKAELEPETSPQDANEDDTKGAEGKDAEETVSELNRSSSHQRQPSLSLQSKMRSSSFRQSSISGGPLSPNPFSPEGDTAPDIHRKQALRIEELEKENKRLAKEATDGEKRWKKAEEELEDLREAEGDVTSKGKDTSSAGSSGELQKLVSISLKRLSTSANQMSRGLKLLLFNGKTPNFKHNHHERRDMDPLPPYRQQRRQILKLLYGRRTLLSNLWKLRFPISGHNWSALLLAHLLKKNKLLP